jgi:two-component system, NarL family, nitrate/nitrite response regulator NarL
MAVINVVIVTPTRLLGESLTAWMRTLPDVRVTDIAGDCTELTTVAPATRPQVVLIDVTQGLDAAAVRVVVARCPELPLLALGVPEHDEAIIGCVRAGFLGYVPRDASLARLHQTIVDAAAGRVNCPSEIMTGLMRALRGPGRIHNPATPPGEADAMQELTRRENEVATWISRGLSNKEIARALQLSVPTVKHHVHNILAKLRLPNRSHVARILRESAWHPSTSRAQAAYQDSVGGSPRMLLPR